MKRVLLFVVVGVLVASLFLGAANYAAAGGTSTGTFPTRTFSIVRDAPGGPRLDRISFDIVPDQDGYWSVIAESVAGSNIIVEVYQVNAGISVLASSSKVRYPGDQSTPTQMSAGLTYEVSFTPYGKAGTSILHEHFASPYPPVAAFTFDPAEPLVGQVVTFDASSSTDLNGDIASYAWDFGDGTTGSGVTTTHAFASVDTFTVALTVTDSTSLTSTASHSVVVSPIPNVPPTAAFSVSRDLSTASVDASASADTDGFIADFSWDWGDGSSESTGTTPTAAHAYVTPGMYVIALTVTDDVGAQATVQHGVSVGTSTEDWSFFDFFNVPYGEWWDLRQMYGVTGDVPVGADCFSQAGIDNAWCVPSGTRPAVASSPYASWVLTPMGDAMVVAPYRFSVDIHRNPAITVDQPIMLPTCADLQTAAEPQGVTIVCPASPPAGGSLGIDEHISYLTNARAIQLADPLGSNCPDLTYLNDGWVTELQATITMDSAAAAKLFGITDPSQMDFGTADTSLLKASCGSGLLTDPSSGVLEQGLKAWFEAQGNGPYDILSVNNAPMSVFSVEASGSYDSLTGQYALVLDLTGWGFEQLFARWAYWGSTSYIAGLSGAAPAGWWGMEMPWTEDLSFNANVDATGFDAQAVGVIQYHLRASATAGPDTIWYTADDVPMWVWAPVLGDRYPAVPGHMASELQDYAGLTYLHTTPASHRYGQYFDYDYVPAVWALKPGETQTFQFPTSAAAVFVPTQSGHYDMPSMLTKVSATLVLGGTPPVSAGGSYDAVSNTLVELGPVTLGSYPVTGSGKPLEGRPIYALVQG